jgi:predicted nucleic acid-binding protein
MAHEPVSAPQDRIVLDNSVISTFHDARVLSSVLELWPGRWLVPLEVQGDAAAWPAHGAAVSATLQRLRVQRIIEVTAVNPRVEGPLSVQLTRRLGQGESAVIAIAANRGLIAALDDRRARRACDQLSTPVSWVATEGILGFAVADGLLTRAEAEAIWQATGILDPRRRVP